MMLRMKRITSLFLLLCFLSAAAFTEQKPSFEVASIKPAAPSEPGRIRIGMQADGGMLRYTNVTLMDVIRNAYRVKEFQIEGPDWLSSERFDITAKLPDGAEKDKVPEMLQSLLEERFKIAIHTDTKEHAIYALVAGKNGPKLTASQSAPSDERASAGAPGPNAPPPPAAGVMAKNGGPGAPGPNRQGTMMMMMGPNGMHWKTVGVTLAALADGLSRFCDRPIVDNTGIEGRFDFEMDFMPEAGGMRRMGGMGAPPPAHAAGDGAPAADSSGEPAQTIYEAVQKYGLKLEPRKAPMPVIIIDHIERMPTEN